MSQETPSSSLPRERSQAAVALDNLIRRQLRVSDPTDADAVSKALRERYRDDQLALEQEAAGLPFFKVTRIDSRCVGEDSSRIELRQAQDDVQKDLVSLTGNALLKDIHPELRGWSQAIRQAMADGTTAARFALDPWQRDHAMATRRLLGDYARVVRFVGALTPNMSGHYRSLAQSLDEVAGVILVTIGETLAQAGYGGGRFLLQAPASELQARRETVINALRNLVGTTQSSYGPSDWPYGPVAYRQVMHYLEQNGLTDLRTLFQENLVARAMDDLTYWATRGSTEDLRALGATAQLTLARFRRLVLLTRHVPVPESPPFSAYLNAIQLFLEAFSNGAGYRLLYIARPPIVYYGLYGIGGPDDGTRRMLRLTELRGRLAQALDCYLGCDCGSDKVRCQILLDKILYDVDRAIDLYVMGTDPEGQGKAEQRAAAFGALIDQLLPDIDGYQAVGLSLDAYPGCEENADLQLACGCAGQPCVPKDSELESILHTLRNCLWWACDAPSDDEPVLEDFTGLGDALSLMNEELCVQRDAEAQWENLLHTMAPSCFSWSSKLDNGCAVTPANQAKPTANAQGLLVPTQDLVEAAICAVDAARNVSPSVCPDLEVGIPAHLYTSQAGLSYGRSANGTQVNQRAVTDMALCIGNQMASRRDEKVDFPDLWPVCGPTDFVSPEADVPPYEKPGDTTTKPESATAGVTAAAKPVKRSPSRKKAKR